MQITAPVVLSGWWGPSSALVAYDSVLSKIKQKMVKKLLEHKIITQSDLINDLRNVTPHISLTDGKKYPRCQKAYDKLNQKQLHLSETSLNVNANYLDISIGHSGRKGCHFTLCWATGVGAHAVLVKTFFRDILNELNGTCDAKGGQEEKVCIICLTLPYNMLFNCGHVCVCETCASTLLQCPMCRASVTTKSKIFCA